MKRLLCILVFEAVVLPAVYHSKAGEPSPLSISSNVGAELALFDKGLRTLDDLTQDRNKEWHEHMLLYGTLHPTNVTAKMKLPISRSAAALERYQRAVDLATEYVQIYSNDWRGWRIVGGAQMFLGKHEAAMKAFSQAVQLGDERDRAALAFAAIKAGHLEVVQPMVPLLVRLETRHAIYDADKLDVAVALALYSIMAKDESTFIKAVDGLSADEVSSREDLAALVTQGCELFKSDAVKKIANKMRAIPPTGEHPGK